jgi:IS30 family transposase
MTGADLRQLRYGYALDSAVRLAKRIGVHPSTIYRNERRERVTDYVSASVDVTPTAAAFVRGMNWGDK